MTLRHLSFTSILIQLILIGIFGGMIYYATYYWRPGEETHIEKTEGAFNIATLNAGGFRHLVEPNETANLIQYVAEQNDIDILCLQEVVIGQELTLAKFKKIFNKQFPYIAVEDDEAILSKYPILDRKQKAFMNSDNSYSWNDVMIGQDTVRLINLHFQTTGVHSVQRLRQNDPAALAKVSFRNGDVRKYQAHLVQMDIYNSPYKPIIVGDFNAIPLSKAYRMIKAENIRDSFMEMGRGLGGTFRYAFNFIRIDYIMHEESISCLGYKTVSDFVSDHKMIMATLKID
ncbi:MAG: endonuclease/exonuclease/phosphatase family protein [Bacteroidales bacterium]|nr:endonuclease/exonuclease/phosphatase family protein [Bacteroidales bacterium]